MSKKVFTVVGSSGIVGSAVIKEVSSKLSDKYVVQAGVRDPSSDKAGPIGKLSGVTLVKANFGEEEALGKVLKGSDVVFINTPGHEDRTKLGIHGVNAAKAAGVKHIIVVSVLTADLTDTIFGRQFAPLEKHVKESGLKYTLLRLPFFIDNNWGSAGSIKSQGKFYGPNNPDAKFTPIAVSDIAEATVGILKDLSKHENKTYKVTTKAHNHKELAEAFSSAVGKEVTYVQVPYEAAKQSFLGFGIPEWQVDGILELFKLFDAKSSVTNDETNDFKTLTGRDPTTIQQWAAAVAAGFK